VADEVFGPLIDATVVERAVIRHLAPPTLVPGGVDWLNTYLAVVEARAGYAKGTLARVRTYQADVDVRRFPEQQLPALIVVVGDETPVPDGQNLHAQLTLVVGVIARGATRQQGRDLARLHAAAIKGALLHRPDLSGTLAALTYDGAGYTETRGDPGVVAAVANVEFTALVPATIDLFAGPDLPAVPLPTPPDVPDWPTYPGRPTADEIVIQAHPEEEITP